MAWKILKNCSSSYPPPLSMRYAGLCELRCQFDDFSSFAELKSDTRSSHTHKYRANGMTERPALYLCVNIVYNICTTGWNHIDRRHIISSKSFEWHRTDDVVATRNVLRATCGFLFQKCRSPPKSIESGPFSVFYLCRLCNCKIFDSFVGVVVTHACQWGFSFHSFRYFFSDLLAMESNLHAPEIRAIAQH